MTNKCDILKDNCKPAEWFAEIPYELDSHISRCARLYVCQGCKDRFVNGKNPLLNFEWKKIANIEEE